MPQFAVNTTRTDPYMNFKFIVELDGRQVAGVSKVSAFKQTTDKVSWKAGGEDLPHALPGNTKFEPITLEQGLTHDTTLADWAGLVSNSLGAAATSPRNFRKEVTIKVLNMQGTPVMTFVLHRAWVTEFQALPELDANANAVALQSVKLEYESLSVTQTEPTET